jgi:hypothetical protein
MMRNTQRRYISKNQQRAASRRRVMLLTRELESQAEKSEKEDENGRFESEGSTRRVSN